MAQVPPQGFAQTNDTARLEAFSDGVIAIAITLLVLEISFPTNVRSVSDFWHTLGNLWPSYAAYALSFVIIGIMWVNHHNLFRMIYRNTHPLLMLNLLLLMGIAFVPFPTAVLARHLDDSTLRGPAAVFYCGTFTLIALMFNVLWHYCLRAGVLGAQVSPRAVADTTRRYLAGPPGYGLATGLAFVSAFVSLAIVAALALLYFLPIGDATMTEE